MKLDVKLRENTPANTREEILTFANDPTAGKVRNFSSYTARKVGETSAGPALEFIGVSEGIKRDGSTIHVPGIQLDHIRANPVFQWAHGYSSPPIGTIQKFIRGKTDKLGRVLSFVVTPIDISDCEHKRFSDMVFEMYVNGCMRTVSFGWKTVEAEPIRDADGFFTGYNFKRTDALEFSAVPVPADPDALLTDIRQFGKGLDVEKAMQLFTTRADKGTIYTVREVAEIKEGDETVKLESGPVQVEEELTSTKELTSTTVAPVALGAMVLTPVSGQSETVSGVWLYVPTSTIMPPTLTPIGVGTPISTTDFRITWPPPSVNEELEALKREIAGMKELAFERKGAVLNRANKEALTKIVELARSILDSAGGGEEDEDDDEESDRAVTPESPNTPTEERELSDDEVASIVDSIVAQRKQKQEARDEQEFLRDLAQRRAKKVASTKQ